MYTTDFKGFATALSVLGWTCSTQPLSLSLFVTTHGLASVSRVIRLQQLIQPLLHVNFSHSIKKIWSCGGTSSAYYKQQPIWGSLNTLRMWLYGSLWTAQVMSCCPSRSVRVCTSVSRNEPGPPTAAFSCLSVGRVRQENVHSLTVANDASNFKPIFIVKSFLYSSLRWVGHVARMGEERGVYRVLVGQPEGRNHWGDLGVDGWIILGWICGMWVYGLDWAGPG